MESKNLESLFNGWFTSLSEKNSMIEKTFEEFSFSEKEDYLKVNFPNLIPAENKIIDILTRVKATENVSFETIGKIAKLNGVESKDIYTFWTEAIEKETTFENVPAKSEWSKAGQRNQVSYLQNSAGVSNSTKVSVPILGGETFKEFVKWAYNKIEAEESANKENGNNEIENDITK